LSKNWFKFKPDVILAIAIAAAMLPFSKESNINKSPRTVAAKAATTAVPTAHCRIACDRAQLYWGCDRLDLRSAVRLGCAASAICRNRRRIRSTAQ
jgi:hypothetical protein